MWRTGRGLEEIRSDFCFEYNDGEEADHRCTTTEHLKLWCHETYKTSLLEYVEMRPYQILHFLLP